MSRTTRKRIEKFEQMYDYYLNSLYCEKQLTHNKKVIGQLKAKYYGRSGNIYACSLPKYFRKFVNHHRRMCDKQELHKEMFLENYAGNYCQWNAKSVS